MLYTKDASLKIQNIKQVILIEHKWGSYHLLPSVYRTVELFDLVFSSWTFRV